MNLKREEIDKLIDNAFMVFKKESFYDNYSQINKGRISLFENDKRFNDEMQSIKDNIYFALYNGHIKEDFLNDLIKKVSFFPQLKKKTDEKNKEWTLNFYIDLPIELQIIDYAWSLLILTNKNNYKNCHYLYANKFNESIIDKNPFEDNFRKKLLFKRYKHGYNLWLNDVQKSFNKKIGESDITLLTIDFKRFFYHIDKSLDNFDIQIDNKYKNLYNLLSFILKRYYKTYTNEIKRFLNEIKDYEYILPIGLPSSKILSNYALEELDKKLKLMDDLIYYGRYVDDIILLFKNEKEEENLVDSVKKTINNTRKHNNFKLNSKKIKYYHYPKGASDDKLFFFLNRTTTSYSPNISEHDFSTAYNLLFDLERRMIKDNLKSRHMTAQKFYSLNAKDFLLIWTFLLNREVLDSKEVKKIERRIFSEISYKTNSFFINSAVNFFKTTKMNSLLKYYNDLHQQIKFDLKDITFDRQEHKNIINQDFQYLKTRLIYYYNYKIDICFIINNIKNEDLNNHKLTYDKLKQSGFVRFIPISNHFIDKLNKHETVLPSAKEYFGNSLQFIQFHDLKMYYSLKKLLCEEAMPPVNNIYSTMNNLVPKKFYESTVKKNKLNNLDYRSRTIKIYSKDSKEEFVVSQPNINLSDVKVQFDQSFYGPTLEESFAFYRILNESKRNRTNLIVFPEFYIKLDWLYNLASFCRNEEIDAIFGIQPFFKKGYYVNILGSIYSNNGNPNKMSLPILRIKNNYSHKEKQYYSPVFSTKIKRYINIEKDNYSSTALLCFEATDIVARAIFKGRTDLIAVPMLNRDTTYFNNILESLSRDLSVIVVSCNSFEKGNSIIVQPTKTYKRIITEFKGGFNNYLVSSFIPLTSLREYNKSPNNKNEFKPHPAGFNLE